MSLVSCQDVCWDLCDHIFLWLQIPRDLKTGGKQSIRAKLSVFGGPVNKKRVFSKSEIISIVIPKNSVFIQTDKPVYKPGQTGNAFWKPQWYNDLSFVSMYFTRSVYTDMKFAWAFTYDVQMRYIMTSLHGRVKTGISSSQPSPWV